MEKFVIDTNFFFNLEIKSGFGKNPLEVIKNFSALASQLKKQKKASFYMPPSIMDELVGFFENKDKVPEVFLATIVVKSPDKSKIEFPAPVFYDLVGETRERSYKGLKIAEDAVLKGAKEMVGEKEMAKPEFEKKIGKTIKNLRERYRQATRFNFLDSLADVDLIVLTKEIGGFLVSSDEGVVRWGRIFGIKEVDPSLFRQRLLSLSKS